MKIILTDDIKSLGKRGSIVTVTDGYARNFLFPKKLAVVASDSALPDSKDNEGGRPDPKSRGFCGRCRSGRSSKGESGRASLPGLGDGLCVE